MLILTRKLGEGLFIGDEIRITVIEIRGKQVRLGIEAPSDIVVLREELYRRVKEQNLQAADLATVDLKKIAKLWCKENENDPKSPKNPK